MLIVLGCKPSFLKSITSNQHLIFNLPLLLMMTIANLPFLLVQTTRENFLIEGYFLKFQI